MCALDTAEFAFYQYFQHNHNNENKHKANHIYICCARVICEYTNEMERVSSNMLSFLAPLLSTIQSLSFWNQKNSARNHERTESDLKQSLQSTIHNLFQ